LKKKLHLLELVLVVLNVLVIVRVRDKWLEARKREQVVLGQRLKQVPPAPYTPLPEVQPVSAADYAPVVQKDLFSADRNPTVVVEVAAPKPMPPLPLFYGLLSLPGSGPLVIMSEKSGEPEKGVRFGEKVGEFTLVAANADEVVLEWEGQQIRKKPSELEAKEPERASAAAGPTPRPAAAQQPVRNETGPGTKDLGNKGWKACQPGDTSPAGTVRDGMIKVMRALPIGVNCHWEPAP
jgi:hypothetical protein